MLNEAWQCTNGWSRQDAAPGAPLGPVGLAEMLGILAAGCGLRPRALALERMWIHSRFGTVGDTSSHPGPSRLARHSAHDFMIFCAFCIVSRPPTILKRY